MLDKVFKKFIPKALTPKVLRSYNKRALERQPIKDREVKKMAKTRNGIVLNVISRCENADEVVGAIGALITTGLVSMNDVIKTMYNRYAEAKSSYDEATSSYDDEMSYYDNEIAALNEENAELRTKITELKNDLEKAKAEMIWGDDIPVKLKELLKELL